MKIAVFSDTHGSYRGMINAVGGYMPDQVIHLGDGAEDVLKIQKEFPTLPVISVAGNCDHEVESPEYKVVRLGGHTLFLTHGHRYAVRYGKLDMLLYAAQCSEADIAMFGHTHRAGFEVLGGMYVLNPGTAGRGPEKTWARLELNGSEVSCTIENIE